MARKYKQNVDGGNPANPDIQRRDWLKMVGAGGLILAAGYGATKLIQNNPEALIRIEKLCNQAMREQGIADVENIHERIARYEKELEERLEDATPIRTFDELNRMRDDLEVNYRLEDDIRCPKGHNWVPIGTPEKPFVGTLNGLGHTIYDLRAEWPERDYVGMFGCSRGEIGDKLNINAIANLRLENVLTHGRLNVGKLTGLSCSFFADCHTKGVSRGISCVGGNSGLAHSIFLRCSDEGPVDGEKYVGFVGMSGSYFIDCIPNYYVKKDKVNCKGSLAGFHSSDKDGGLDYSESIINTPGEVGKDSLASKDK